MVGPTAEKRPCPQYREAVREALAPMGMVATKKGYTCTWTVVHMYLDSDDPSQRRDDENNILQLMGFLGWLGTASHNPRMLLLALCNSEASS
eukprot:4994676-Amphidinium_carterae.1